MSPNNDDNGSGEIVSTGAGAALGWMPSIPSTRKCSTCFLVSDKSSRSSLEAIRVRVNEKKFWTGLQDFQDEEDYPGNLANHRPPRRFSITSRIRSAASG